MFADDHVVPTDNARESTDREDDWQGRKAGGNKCRADDVGFTGSPVAIKQRGSARPTDVAGTMCDRFEHLCRVRIASNRQAIKRK